MTRVVPRSGEHRLPLRTEHVRIRVDPRGERLGDMDVRVDLEALHQVPASSLTIGASSST